MTVKPHRQRDNRFPEIRGTGRCEPLPNRFMRCRYRVPWTDWRLDSSRHRSWRSTCSLQVLDRAARGVAARSVAISAEEFV